MAPGVLEARRRRRDGALVTTLRLDPEVRERVVAYLEKQEGGGGTLSAAVDFALRRALGKKATRSAKT